MATKRVRFCRIDADGETTTFHLETDSRIVLRPDGTNVEDALVNLGSGLNGDSASVSPVEFNELKEKVSSLTTAALDHVSKDALTNLKNELMTELDKKVSYSKPVKFTISKAVWQDDYTAGYPYFYNIPAPGVTEDNVASIVMSPASVDVAAIAVICPTCETLDGFIRVRCKNVPTADLSGQYTYV